MILICRYYDYSPSLEDVYLNYIKLQLRIESEMLLETLEKVIVNVQSANVPDVSWDFPDDNWDDDNHLISENEDIPHYPALESAIRDYLLNVLLNEGSVSSSNKVQISNLLTKYFLINSEHEGFESATLKSKILKVWNVDVYDSLSRLRRKR